MCAKNYQIWLRCFEEKSKKRCAGIAFWGHAVYHVVPLCCRLHADCDRGFGNIRSRYTRHHRRRPFCQVCLLFNFSTSVVRIAQQCTSMSVQNKLSNLQNVQQLNEMDNSLIRCWVSHIVAHTWVPAGFFPGVGKLGGLETKVPQRSPGVEEADKKL